MSLSEKIVDPYQVLQIMVIGYRQRCLQKGVLLLLQVLLLLLNEDQRGSFQLLQNRLAVVTIVMLQGVNVHFREWQQDSMYAIDIAVKSLCIFCVVWKMTYWITTMK